MRFCLSCLQQNIITASDGGHNTQIRLPIEHDGESIAQNAIILDDEYSDGFHGLAPRETLMLKIGVYMFWIKGGGENM
jgi:hypothetical protein